MAHRAGWWPCCCREAEHVPEGSIPNSDWRSGGRATPQICWSPFWQTTSKRAFWCGLMNRRESPAWGTHRLQGRSFQLQASVGVIRASSSRNPYCDIKAPGVTETFLFVHLLFFPASVFHAIFKAWCAHYDSLLLDWAVIFSFFLAGFFTWR